MPLLRRVSVRLLLVCSALLTLTACGTPLPSERSLELTVTAAGYEPTQLEARTGEMVVIRFRNRDTIAHSLSLELPTGIRTISVEPGVDALVSFPVSRPGTYRFFCPVAGHLEEGVLVVRDEG